MRIHILAMRSSPGLFLETSSRGSSLTVRNWLRCVIARCNRACGAEFGSLQVTYSVSGNLNQTAGSLVDGRFQGTIREYRLGMSPQYENVKIVPDSPKA